jgi:hypothetical protein
MYKIKRFFKRIYNLYRWLPIIWKDQDWDTSYIWEVWKFKLKNQAEYIGKRGHHVNNERDAERIMTCVKLIDRIQDEFYLDEPHAYHITKWNWDDYEKSVDEFFELKSETLSEHFDDYFEKYVRIYKLVKKGDWYGFDTNEREGAAFAIGHINHKRALKLLFKLLENHIQEWWD